MDQVGQAGCFSTENLGRSLVRSRKNVPVKRFEGWQGRLEGGRFYRPEEKDRKLVTQPIVSTLAKIGVFSKTLF
jgi:hypothetical protein